jgi:hypothetical protein
VSQQHLLLTLVILGGKVSFKVFLIEPLGLGEGLDSLVFVIVDPKI